jgi:hypothetical protein
MLPALPPSKRTVMGECAEPFQASNGAKDVNVQISPASQRVELARQRARRIRPEARVISATDIRARVVAVAAAAYASSEAQSRIVV